MYVEDKLDYNQMYQAIAAKQARQDENSKFILEMMDRITALKPKYANDQKTLTFLNDAYVLLNKEYGTDVSENGSFLQKLNSRIKSYE